MQNMSERFGNFLITSLEFFVAALILVIGSLALWAIVAYILDVTQTRHAIRRNYPVIGRFRYFFEHLGEFFRHYFFAMDRAELPFNRAERSWVYRAAKDLNNTVAFGSTRDLRRYHCRAVTRSGRSVPREQFSPGRGSPPSTRPEARTA